MKTSFLFAAVFLPSMVASFGVKPTSGTTFVSRSSTSLSMTKGFDKNKPEPKEKSAGQAEREEKSTQYDNIAASGGQEYSIFVRQFGGEDESWLPCGSIAVQRGAQVSDAIFGNEEPLKTAIVRSFPKLKGYETEFEYGYHLKVFPDEPVTVAVKNGPKSRGPSLGNWISNLLSPIDASKAAPPS